MAPRNDSPLFVKTYGDSMPHCVAGTQARRGLGLTVALYYLGKALTARGLRVLLMDLTGRRSRIQALAAQSKTPGLTIWTPSIPQPQQFAEALARVRQQAVGKFDALLLDIDSAYLQSAHGIASGLDYALVFVEPSDAGLREADRLAARLDDTLPPWGKVAVVLSRISAASAGELPEQTPDRGTPILGGFPADYLLATSDEYALKDGARLPHDAYLAAMTRLARSLAQIVPLTRAQAPEPGTIPAPRPTTPHDSSNHTHG